MMRQHTFISDEPFSENNYTEICRERKPPQKVSLSLPNISEIKY